MKLEIIAKECLNLLDLLFQKFLVLTTFVFYFYYKLLF